jgi:hypothetical protein
LLKGDQATTDCRCGNFGLIDGDNTRSKTDGVTSDDTANDKHAAVLERLLSGNNKIMKRCTYDGRTLQNRTNDPEQSRNDDRFFATNLVTEVGDREGTH